MNVRLIFAIISTLLEEAALVVIVLLVLPQFGIYLPLAGLITLMVVLGGYAVISYRVVGRALRRRPVIGLPAMVGSKGKVVTRLAPEGMVRIKSELWEAKSTHGNIDKGEEIVVVGQDGLSLVVSKNSIGK
ncbi:NfeD family protein [Chloroflexota bacterium]